MGKMLDLHVGVAGKRYASAIVGERISMLSYTNGYREKAECM